MRSKSWVAPVLGALTLATAAQAQVQITEFMYDGTGSHPEFVEFTNRGAAPVDMTGWIFDDGDGTAGNVLLSAFGMVAPNESVVVGQVPTVGGSATTFRTVWGLPATVKVIAYTTGQLQRNGDTIKLFDAGSVLVTQLAYGDTTFPGTIRTQGRSGWPCAEVIGQSPIATSWNLSAVADFQGSFASTEGNIGSPGSYTHHFCVAPPTGACCALGLCEDDVTQDDCEPGGTYQGDNSECINVSCPAPTNGMIRITEYMYDSTTPNQEFVEFTNLDSNPIDMTGWSYDDDSNTPNSVDLSAFGVVQPGESVILTEASAAAFIANWNLSGVTVIGGSTHNLSRADTINLYDANDSLVDRLGYGDNSPLYPGTIRTQRISGYPCEDAVGNNDIFHWYLSKIGDGQSSYAATSGDIGNPGTYVDIPCPVCGNSTIDVGEDCEIGDCCTNCHFRTVGSTCRASAGDCDLGEVCTGNSADCPPDVLADSSVECRASAGLCDPAEHCDGLGVDCPADLLTPAGTECHASAGDCDPAELCNGNSPDCPVDMLTPPGTECRASGGDCDPAESCDGSSPTCPDDALTPGGTECRPSAGDCDPAEACTGQSPTCPPDALTSAGTACRTAAGQCDVTENCDGASPSCPPDALLNGTECRPAAGLCDVAENCNGTSVDCPADGFSSGNTCRPSTGPCDPAETCAGNGTQCPPDEQITSCGAVDGCCVANCNETLDTDCDPVCGNGVVETGEGCDDSNTADGDGCSSLCQPEFTPIPTVSEWGLVVLALALLTLAKLRADRDRATHTA